MSTQIQHLAVAITHGSYERAGALATNLRLGPEHLTYEQLLEALAPFGIDAPRFDSAMKRAIELS